jgi:hypothetical protein
MDELVNIISACRLLLPTASINNIISLDVVQHGVGKR